MTAPPDPQNNPNAAGVVEIFRKQGIHPESAVLYAYAAVQVLKGAIEKADSLDPKTVSKIIRSGVVFPTVLGDISFDKKGDVNGDHFVIYEWIRSSSGHAVYQAIKDMPK